MNAFNFRSQKVTVQAYAGTITVQMEAMAYIIQTDVSCQVRLSSLELLQVRPVHKS